jgi:cell division protease FtsH
MNDDSSQKDNRGKPPEPGFNWRGVILFAIAFALIGGAIVFRGGPYGNLEEVSYPQFVQLLEQGRIVQDPEHPVELVIEESHATQYIRGHYRKVLPGKPETALPLATPAGPPLAGATPPPDLVNFRTPVYLDFNQDLQEKLQQAGIIPTIKRESNYLASAIIGFLPIALFLLILYFLFRQQIRMAGKGALNFGKSKARLLSRDRNKITFKDVAGVEEAKEEVQEIVDFLKDPKKFQKLGGRIPKGVLLVGSPGTGKTLLAKAIAGEADVPFFSISGSDFVEMFVGVGASRVRDMFEQGKRSAPCLIFIDEIDAVGRHRGHGLGGGHDEREQTLNALLVEMDGFDTQEGVIIIAATNRPDVLDPALLRPGRFDRQITVSLPDVNGREEILKVHAKRVKLASGVDLAKIARGTPGFSGAELANVVNEAALLASRRGLKAITLSELEEARDKVRWGRERRSLAMSEREKTSTAWHEAGHALVNVLLEHTDPLHKVTIIPRGPYLGAMMELPKGDKYSLQYREALDKLAVTAAGRIAEELFTKDISTGASSDIKQMTRLARRMVCEWGMSEKLGMVEYGEHEDYVFLGRDINRSRDYSEQTAQEIDREVRALIDSAYERAKDLLTKHREQLALLAKALLEYETLDADQVRELVEHGRMLNPPKPPGANTGGTEEKPPQQKEASKGIEDLPGGLTGQPA